MLFALWMIANINACQEKDAPIQETDFTSDELDAMAGFYTVEIQLTYYLNGLVIINT